MRVKLCVALLGIALAGSARADGAAPEQAGPLAPLVGRMEEVEKDLVREETGEITQAKVAEILAELDQLIDRIEPPRMKISAPRPHPSDESAFPPPPSDGRIPIQQGFPSEPMRDSRAVERGGEGPLPPFKAEGGGWGRRVPVASEKYAVHRAREDRMPREYETYLAEYFRVLTVFASRD